MKAHQAFIFQFESLHEDETPAVLLGQLFTAGDPASAACMAFLIHFSPNSWPFDLKWTLAVELFFGSYFAFVICLSRMSDNDQTRAWNTGIISHKTAFEDFVV